MTAGRAVRRPSRAELAALAERRGVPLAATEQPDYEQLVDDVLSAYDTLDSLPDPAPPAVAAVRQVGERPGDADDPLNAVLRRVSVRATNPTRGALAGRRVGIMDSMAVAGVPMSCGSRLLAGYTPCHDATVVRRILEAGGEITAITNADDFGFAGTGHTSAYGATINPHDPGRVAGGSSSGSAAAVTSGLLDLALGTDQGGSIRIPAAWCGIAGLAPTYGLVPYTGIAGLDATLDRVGPLAATVEDLADLLAVLAGRDEDDPRQAPVVPVEDYRAALGRGVEGLRIGVLTEGFGGEASDPRVDTTVRQAADRFARLGALVSPVSVPQHAIAPAVWTAVAIEGGAMNFLAGGQPDQAAGRHDAALRTAILRATAAGGELSPTVKLGLLVGTWVRERYCGAFYSRARNQVPGLARAYDHAFEEVDLLLLPTTPQLPHELPPPLAVDRLTHVRRALDMVGNTAPFNLTGHPALSLPCGWTEHLPVGMMLAGRRFEDATLLAAGHAYESAHGTGRTREEEALAAAAVVA